MIRSSVHLYIVYLPTFHSNDFVRKCLSLFTCRPRVFSVSSMRCHVLGLYATASAGSNSRSRSYAYIELQCWPVQCHPVYTKYTHGPENCDRGNPQVTTKIKEFAKMCCALQHQPGACASDLGDGSCVTCTDILY